MDNLPDTCAAAVPEQSAALSLEKYFQSLVNEDQDRIPIDQWLIYDENPAKTFSCFLVENFGLHELDSLSYQELDQLLEVIEIMIQETSFGEYINDGFVSVDSEFAFYKSYVYETSFELRVRCHTIHGYILNYIKSA